ncbi:hypothetical protein [Oharaeibacter diazotrophicus]|uniref:Uncharacterized protein n=1 Tax=Oharaeibacter diazotrophicus TaxID=1920512 RepID=A0A4R6RFF9_9HYPH|nr:hypothetical protein [Oharaeibacter diazotrophicus]TDP85059.1 hypothetical protein EDD54_1904 [Oharaeibacter diazotrophicus]BBE74029.1 hypothetical protein OHA_1_03655 [Pleomorphomonas sp. SM30]GLS76283.1 hypothetical protein GCM10007904_16180 [Oharaeibacter diazotrophicus]
MDLSDLVDFVLFLVRPGWRRPGRAVLVALALLAVAALLHVGGGLLDGGGGLLAIGATLLAVPVAAVAAVVALGAVVGAIAIVVRRFAGGGPNDEGPGRRPGPPHGRS